MTNRQLAFRLALAAIALLAVAGIAVATVALVRELTQPPAEMIYLTADAPGPASFTASIADPDALKQLVPPDKPRAPRPCCPWFRPEPV